MKQGNNLARYVLLVAITVVAGTLPLFVQYGDYLFCCDYSTQLIPFIAETKRMLASGTPFWSWNTYYGDNFIGSYSYYTITSPFVWLLCLLPYGWLVKGCFVVLVLKYICAFLTSRLYLRKMGITLETASVGGLLYAFSSFVVSNSFYSIFFEPLIAFPLLLVAVERFLRKERYGATALLGASFLVIFINYYVAVCSFIAAAMYLVCRWWFSEVRLSVGRLAMGVAMVLLGIALDALVLFPTAQHLAGGPRTSGHIMSGLDRTVLPFFVERVRVLFMPQVLEEPTPLLKGSGFNSQSVCLPLVGMMLAALYCWRNRKNWLTALLALSLLIFLTPLNTGFSFFTNPNYTRWAYALCLFLVLASCRWLDGKSALRPGQVGLYALCVMVVYVLALLYGRRGNPKPVPYIQLAAYALVTLVNLAVLWVCTRKKGRRMLAIGICLCAATQMAVFHTLRSDVYFATREFRELGYFGNYKGYGGMMRTYLVDNHLARKDGNTNYRSATISRFSNMATLTNRADVQAFHSIQNNAIRRLICAADTTMLMSRNNAIPCCNQRSFYALMSVKELVAFDDPFAPFDEASLKLTEKERGDGYTIYDNADYLPMGFTYDSYIEEALIDTLNARKPKPDVPLQMLANLAVPKEEEAFFAKHLRHGSMLDSSVTKSDSSVTKSDNHVTKSDNRATKSDNPVTAAVTPAKQTGKFILDSLVAERRRHTASSFEGTTTGFTSEITLPREDVVFYSVPADKGFTAYVDGKPAEIHACNLGLSAVLVPRGTHTVEFRFLPRGFREGAAVSLVALLLGLGVMLIERRSR